ncbi:organic cation transporter protein isoform X2 [Periplaneta americana]|uniref:organic cation transporter protein isoform X2 n=1 Tax=Periplaneta americana TaxID=6978 RepID=UPI0037E7F879
MTADTMPPPTDGLHVAMERMGEKGPWLWAMFFLLCTPGVLNIWHLTAYVFLGQNLPHWCYVPELTEANWTATQIRNISSTGGLTADSCKMYTWNYSLLAEMTYVDALEYTSSHKRPGQYECDKWSFEGEGMVSEWDLVCSRLPLKSTLQMAVALGKFLGALIFGFVADKWGRKRSFTISCITYIIAGPVATFAPYYLLFYFARVALGMAGTGAFNSGFTLLAEFCTKKHRTILGILYNMSYPVGMMILPVIALYIEDWRMLQLALSVPAVLLVIHIWILPESARWLVSQGRREEAWKIVKKFSKKSELVKLTMAEANDATTANEDIHKETPAVPAVPSVSSSEPWYKRSIASLKKLFVIFSHRELRRRLLICHFAWCVTAMTYYALALNADNFTANKYIYVAVAGAVEAVGYVLPIPMLKFMGRRTTSVVLYFISGVSLLLIIPIPQDMSMTIMGVAMVGRLCIGAVYSVIILQTSELFPTVNRNTAVGTSSTLSHVGSISAPYLVDLIGAKVWYMPSTICGVAVLIAGLLVLLLPETKDKEYCDTIEELMEKNPRDRVSIRNCFPFLKS